MVLYLSIRLRTWVWMVARCTGSGTVLGSGRRFWFCTGSGTESGFGTGSGTEFDIEFGTEFE